MAVSADKGLHTNVHSMFSQPEPGRDASVQSVGAEINGVCYTNPTKALLKGRQPFNLSKLPEQEAVQRQPTQKDSVWFHLVDASEKTHLY